MSQYELQRKVGPDGVLALHVQLGPEAANRDVRVLVDTAPKRPMSQAEWQAFIDEVAGSITDETFVRHPQGGYESRPEIFP